MSRIWAMHCQNRSSLALTTSGVNTHPTSWPCQPHGVVTPQTVSIQQLANRTLIVESSSYQSSIYNMAAPEVHHLFHHPIADHSFSTDRQTLAVARDTSVELYGRTGSGFKLKDELKGHDKLVTSVDIALNSGRIVTCSQGW
jgi:hypothetical protein